MTNFPEKVLEHIFEFLPEHKDRNSVSLVSKTWFRVERWTRKRVFIGNCYAISPERLIARFPNVKALTLKGKPHFADFNLIPEDWGGFVEPWIVAMAKSYPGLEELRLKRMVVTDQNLDLISKAFVEFKSLVLLSCDGFSTDGLAAIAANCKVLTELDLQENVVEDNRGDWLSCFPETCTSLISLNFACLDEDVNLDALERLVARCPNLRSLKLNRTVPLDSLQKIIDQAPELVDLGIGSFTVEPHEDSYSRFLNTVEKCSSIRSLSGFWDVTPHLLDAVYPICSNLTFLNLSYAQIPGAELFELIRHCHNLQRLWILDCIGDKGLEIIASTCKLLQELRVFPSFTGADDAMVTEEGLVAVSTGCPKLHSLLYFCHQMTNAALITVARNCPNFTRFRLCILEPCKPDPVTSEPLDEGFGAIVQSCKGLKRLSLSGLLTDQVFLYIGEYAEQLEMLSVAFSGDSDRGMFSVLNGCKNIRKLEIRDCPFGDGGFLADMGKYETMRSLWLSSCLVTLGACKTLAKSKPKLNVEIINEKDGVEETLDDTEKVEKLYVYRTLDGPRRDAPDFVWSL